MNRRYMKLGAGIAVAALLGAACGDDESEPDVAAADEQPSESGETTNTMEHEGMGASHAGIETGAARSEEHTSELQSLMRISYAVFCLKKKTHQINNENIRCVNISNHTQAIINCLHKNK